MKYWIVIKVLFWSAIGISCWIQHIIYEYCLTEASRLIISYQKYDKNFKVKL
jgi:hypothetical protein